MFKIVAKKSKTLKDPQGWWVLFNSSVRAIEYGRADVVVLICINPFVKVII